MGSMWSVGALMNGLMIIMPNAGFTAGTVVSIYIGIIYYTTVIVRRHILVR